MWPLFLSLVGFFVLLVRLPQLAAAGTNATTTYIGLYPKTCDIVAAQQCEYNKLTCILFSGPANDADANCKCGAIYHGQCLRDAGCNFAKEVGALTQHQIYVKTCVDLIIQYNCADVLICAVNCASQQQINRATSKIIPFNNYGRYYLRVRMCNRKINDKRYAQYAMVQSGYCSDISEYTTCARFIPPYTFIPVAIPIDTTYIEVDSCEQDAQGKFFCHTSNPAPVRIYGNEVIWPRSFDTAQTNASVCSVATQDSKCLGSICDTIFNPPMCQPKALKHILSSGKSYNAPPFSL